MKLWLFVVLATVVAGCDGSDEQVQAVAWQTEAPAGSARVFGTVRLIGNAPEMKSLPNTPCHAGAGALVEETVVVNPDGTLRNVLVWLEDGPLAGLAIDGSKQPPALLDQVNCQYVPHVLALQTKQPLRVRSSDPTMHNVHYVPQKNQAGNLSMTAAGQETTVRFDRQEIVRMKCDVHPWMTAHVGIFPHPFFAVTGDSGTFEVKNVPPGTYKLVTWQEQFGRQEQPLTVIEGQEIEQSIEFKAP